MPLNEPPIPLLLPCPFCGSSARILGGGCSQDYEEVWCNNKKCLAHARPAVWNTRAHPTPDRCKHGVWAADHCYECEKPSPDSCTYRVMNVGCPKHGKASEISVRSIIESRLGDFHTGDDVYHLSNGEIEKIIKEISALQKPVSVSLRACFDAYIAAGDDEWASGEDPMKRVKAVLEAVGVNYVD